MSSSSDKRYRVAEWGTGHSGMASLPAVIEHPSFDLVGVRVYSDQKAGRDAGELCGLGPKGVIATKNIDDIIAAKPECVVYMPVTPVQTAVRTFDAGTVAAWRVEISTLRANKPALQMPGKRDVPIRFTWLRQREPSRERGALCL